MTDFFEMFQPGLRHLREQRDLDKATVVQSKRGDDGPQPLDLDSGHVILRMPPRPRPTLEAGRPASEGTGGPVEASPDEPNA